MKSFDFHEIRFYLKPKNLGNGKLESVSISSLRRILNFFFSQLETNKLKEKFVDYLEDYSIESWQAISNQKRHVKTLEKRIREVENGDDNDITNNYRWEIEQEKYILDFLKEQQFFIRNWVSQKRQELDKLYSSKINKIKSHPSDYLEQITKKVHIPKPLPFYCNVGALFAQGFIYKKGFECYYKHNKFESISELSRYIEDVVLHTNKSTRQYINDTLNDNNGQKNFYKSKKMLKNIIEFCNNNDININDDFQSRYNRLINLH